MAPLHNVRVKQSALVTECVNLRRLVRATGSRHGLIPFMVVRIVLAHLGPRTIPLFSILVTPRTLVRPVLVPIQKVLFLLTLLFKFGSTLEDIFEERLALVFVIQLGEVLDPDVVLRGVGASP